jgi:hypothetical protein
MRCVSRQQVMNAIVPDGEQTKQAVAKAVAKKFPEQLTTQLPEKRRAWESEDYHMAVFDAVALALTFQVKS